MLDLQLHSLPDPGWPDVLGDGRTPPGVTAYLVDVPEIVVGDNSLLEAIAELDATANRFAADTHVLMVVQKATSGTGSAR